MDFFSKIGDALNDAASKAQQSISGTPAQGSFEAKEREQRKIIDEATLAIGRAYVEAHRNDPEACYGEQLSAIREAEQAIAALAAERAAAQRGSCCANCGAPLAENTVFCPQCGTRKPEKQETGGFCGNCGTKLPAAGIAFCPNCGSRLG